jgi:hypothetical protein
MSVAAACFPDTSVLGEEGEWCGAHATCDICRGLHYGCIQSMPCRLHSIPSERLDWARRMSDVRTPQPLHRHACREDALPSYQHTFWKILGTPEEFMADLDVEGSGKDLKQPVCMAVVAAGAAAYARATTAVGLSSVPLSCVPSTQHSLLLCCCCCCCNCLRRPWCCVHVRCHRLIRAHRLLLPGQRQGPDAACAGQPAQGSQPTAGACKGALCKLLGCFCCTVCCCIGLWWCVLDNQFKAASPLLVPARVKSCSAFPGVCRRLQRCRQLMAAVGVESV